MFFKVTTAKPDLVGKLRSTFRPYSTTESPLLLNRIGASIGLNSKNGNKSEFLRASLWNIDILTLVEISVLRIKIGKSIK